MSYMSYVFNAEPGTFNADGLKATLSNMLGVEPALFVDMGGIKATVIVPDSINADTLNAAMASYGNVPYATGAVVPGWIAEWVAWRSDAQDTADAILETIAAMLAEANTDLEGWDLMTTNNKILATKRMLVRHINVLGYIRKIIKFVRYL